MQRNVLKVALATLMLLLAVAVLAMPAAATGEATITRTITPAEVSDGETYNVTLTITFNTDGDSIVIHEVLPATWNLTEVDSGRYIWNTSEEDYTFLDFYETVNLTGVTDAITYSVTVPDGTVSGTYDYGSSYVAGESASEKGFAWTVNTTGDDTVTVNGTILNIYSTALENTNPGAPDPGIPGFVGPNGDGKTDCGTVNPVFITWASRVVDYSPADQSITETFSDPNKTLGPVTGDNFDIVSLGDLDQDQINAGKLPGSVTLGFDLPIADGEGPDLAVFENGFIVSGTEQIFAELAYVEVSTDGAIFARFPSISLTPGLVGGYGSIDPTEAYNLVGKHVNAYGDSWGTPFDLNTLAQEPEVLNGSVDLNSINYVRIVDIPGSGDFKDSRGNPIYDGWVTWGSGGLDLEAVGVINVGVASAPEANFTSDVTSGTAPLTVQFNDASSGVVLDYAWDFDNDGTVDSTLQNPEFTYEAPGTYNVSLTVSNTGGPNTETKANYIVAVLPDSPVADFSIDVTSGPAPLTVQFTDLTTNKPVSWAWDFESDGIIDSYEQNPSWTYNVAGNYTVTLTAANLAASDTVTKVNLTSVDNLPPMADFSADPVATLTGSSVQFTDLSANSPTSWQWDFNNDGTIDSTMQNPNYTYTTAGTYTVNLTVSNPAGNDDEVKTDYIIVREQASPASDFTYTSDGSSVTITEYTGSDGIVIIPAEIEGLPVTTIGASAFSDCSALTTASIPDSVTTIGDYAFIRCSGLTTVTIPDSVTTIGKYAFSSCSALTTVTIGSGVTAISDGVFYNCPSLTTLKIPNSVTTIGASAFSDCSALTTVSIPNSVTIIGGSAFQGCSALTTVTIPDSVTTIGGSAFQDCSGLTTVNIGSGVTNIGNFAFMGCFDLTAIDVDTDNSAYVSIDGILYNKDVTTLVRCPPGKTGSLTIPNSVTTIGYCAFYGCTALTSVTIPNSVTTIDDYAFMGCIALNSVTIGNNVTSIGSSSFYGCTGLTSVNMPDSVTSIGSSAFRDCSALTCMVFEGNAPAIGSSWAPGTNLAVYYYEGVAGFTTPEWQGVPCYSAFVDATGNFSSNIVYGSAPLTVTFTYTGVGANTFAWDFNNNGTVDSTARNPGYTYDVPGTYSVRLNVSNPWGSDCVVKTDYIIAEPVDNFTYISDGTSVTITGYFGPGGDVIIPDTIGGLPVTTIGDSVFQSNTNLTSVITGNNVTSIGSSAFRDCTALTSVTIGNNVTTIGDSAFRGSTALTSMTIPDSAIEIGSHAFRGCTSLASVTVPDSVTVIGNYVFRDCTSLTSATIGNNVTEISRYAFRSCSALTSVTIGNNVTTISSSAFRGSTALSSMVFMGNAPDSVSSSWADGCPDLVVYYQPGATDFTTPTWQGVSCYPILPVFSFMPEDATVINGQTTEIIISVDSLPEGLAGYNLTVDIDDPAVAEIVGIEYSWANLTENSSLPGTSVYLKALDGNRQIEAGATDVVLATLTVKGKQTGNTSFTLGIDRLDDDNGEAINATLDIGTLEVGMTSVPGQENSPQDLDGDGLYEDLSGDGSLSFVDVELYFHHMDWIEDNLPVANFDFNGNGRIDFDDIVDLFEMVA